jgi:hypothetical protein
MYNSMIELCVSTYTRTNVYLVSEKKLFIQMFRHWPCLIHSLELGFASLAPISFKKFKLGGLDATSPTTDWG